MSAPLPPAVEQQARSEGACDRCLQTGPAACAAAGHTECRETILAAFHDFAENHYGPELYPGQTRLRLAADGWL